MTETKTAKPPRIKCVVWDLDNTLWDGTLLENDSVSLRDKVLEVIKTLDSWGILQSIASRNDRDMAMAKLAELGIDEYFLYPQIHRNPKSSSIQAIQQDLNIGMDTILFVDDEPFEREEVAFTHPEVSCLDAANVSAILDWPGVRQKVVTEDAKNRRSMYISAIDRSREEEQFEGPQEKFLETLDMTLTIAEAEESDLLRAEELTVRTNQLNTTGYSYSYDELLSFVGSENHILYVAALDDKFGTYGQIGVALIEKSPGEEPVWTIKLLLMSCRVMTRGVGTVMINHIRRRANEAGARLLAEFITNDRNRMMYVTYRFGGFKQLSNSDGVELLENDLSSIPPMPPYMTIKTAEGVSA